MSIWLAGLSVATFTDPTLSSGMTIKSLHLTEIRTAVDQARTALVVAAIAYNEPAITAGTTTAKVIQMQELRQGVR